MTIQSHRRRTPKSIIVVNHRRLPDTTTLPIRPLDTELDQVVSPDLHAAQLQPHHQHHIPAKKMFNSVGTIYFRGCDLPRPFVQKVKIKSHFQFAEKSSGAGQALPYRNRSDNSIAIL
jgi:hypothetical protein